MEIPNKKVSEMTIPELHAMLGVCYSLYLGVDFEAKENENKVRTLCEETIKYHGNLFAWKLRDLFSYYAGGILDGMNNVEPELHSMFIYKMKKAYFNNPDKVRKRIEISSGGKYSS